MQSLEDDKLQALHIHISFNLMDEVLQIQTSSEECI